MQLIKITYFFLNYIILINNLYFLRKIIDKNNYIIFNTCQFKLLLIFILNQV